MTYLFPEYSFVEIFPFPIMSMPPHNFTYVTFKKCCQLRYDSTLEVPKLNGAFPWHLLIRMLRNSFVQMVNGHQRTPFVSLSPGTISSTSPVLLSELDIRIVDHFLTKKNSTKIIWLSQAFLSGFLGQVKTLTVPVLWVRGKMMLS